MDEVKRQRGLREMDWRFGCDSLIALATLDGGMPAVRTVNAFYRDGSFYVITHAGSGKMRQLAADPHAAVCGEWFTGKGIGEDMGYLLDPRNADMRDVLSTVFAEWYGGGHVDEHDPDTHILRIRLTEGVLMVHGTRYDLIFA